MPSKREYRIAPGPDIDIEQEDVRDSAGHQIDQAYVDRAVRDVHASTTVPGRPSLTAPGKRSPQIGVRLPEALQAAAEARAEREGVSMSVVVRRALEEYLAEA